MTRVLLVEDDAWLADSYRHILDGAGFETQCARDGHEAIRLVETFTPDCIVADVLLEGQTVIGLLHELQSYDDTAQTPVVICTALSHPGIQLEQLHQYGVRAVLDKATLTPEQLLQTVREATV